jgi:glycosyltransferase involved in cell wall biosynthesis
MDYSHPPALTQEQPAERPIPEVSIIVPARNEKVSLQACLESLTAQTGVSLEIIVVDDGSTDRTHEIAQAFAGVQVISAGMLPPADDPTQNHVTGKNNALIAGAKRAQASWLLFTDADTIHLPGSLRRALDEAKREQADLLSYSPKQEVVTLTERAVMPMVFAELAAQYPPHKVRAQNSSVIAANGQYILVRREAYEAVGGHRAVATEILEDVALARQFSNAEKRVYFRYASDAVRTRMYNNWTQLREGWTKNLALLFPHSEFLAYQTVFWWLAGWAALALAAYGAAGGHFSLLILAALWLLLYKRTGQAHFSTTNNLIAIAIGPPIFAYLLLRSKRAHRIGRVSWKGRTYSVGARIEETAGGIKTLSPP